MQKKGPLMTARPFLYKSHILSFFLVNSKNDINFAL